MVKEFATKSGYRIQNLSSSLNKSQVVLQKTVQMEFELCGHMIDHVGDEVMLIDGQGTIIYVNEATVKGLGYSRDTILKKNITRFFNPEISIEDWQQKYFQLIAKSEIPLSFQVERLVKGGKIQTIDVTAVNMSYKSQKFVLSVARDVTQQILIQKQLKESEMRYRSLCEGAGDPIFVIDLKGFITYANPAAQVFLKLPSKDIIGQHFEKFTPTEHMKEAYEHFNKARTDSSQSQFEFSVLNGKGEIVLTEITVSPLVRDGQIEMILSQVRDISQRKELEFLLRESEKMQAVQLFVSGTARELKNPLLAILNRAKALVKKYQSRDFEYIGYKEYCNIIGSLETIQKQVQYCYDTTNRLININQKKVGIRKKSCQVNPVIQEVVDFKQTQFKVTDIQYKLKLSLDIPVVAMGKIDLYQVLLNIINNATQAMPAGGVVMIQSSYSNADKKVRITVKDQGVGISKENLQHLFDPFFTGQHRSNDKNSGLGLPIVYALVKAAQGEINVESSLRKGTAFSIILPAARNFHPLF